MNPRATVGLVVIYRWRLHPGKELQFQWNLGGPRAVAESGLLGTVAYGGLSRPEAARLMRDAEAEVFPPLLLTAVADYPLLDSV